MVYVTLVLERDKLTGHPCLAWSVQGLHATTPRISDDTVTCALPRGIFEHRARVRLQILDSPAPGQPAQPWTQLPVLEETLFQADIVDGKPVLMPLRPPKEGGV